jgi:hypothetical protein
MHNTSFDEPWGNSMRAMRAEGFTGYKDLKLTTMPKPTVTDGRVLVKMKAAGVTPLDHTILSGGHPRAKAPMVLGGEGAGVVEDPGDRGAHGDHRRHGSDLEAREYQELLAVRTTCERVESGMEHHCSIASIEGDQAHRRQDVSVGRGGRRPSPPGGGPAVWQSRTDDLSKPPAKDREDLRRTWHLRRDHDAGSSRSPCRASRGTATGRSRRRS